MSKEGNSSGGLTKEAAVDKERLADQAVTDEAANGRTDGTDQGAESVVRDDVVDKKCLRWALTDRCTRRKDLRTERVERFILFRGNGLFDGLWDDVELSTEVIDCCIRLDKNDRFGNPIDESSLNSPFGCVNPMGDGPMSFRIENGWDGWAESFSMEAEETRKKNQAIFFFTS